VLIHTKKRRKKSCSDGGLLLDSLTPVFWYPTHTMPFETHTHTYIALRLK
jgi:hypothetical protein